MGDYLITRLSNPQYTLEFDVEPYIQSPIEKNRSSETQGVYNYISGLISLDHDEMVQYASMAGVSVDDVQSTINHQILFIEQYAYMIGVSVDEMKEAIKSGDITKLAHKSLSGDTPIAKLIDTIKNIPK